MRLVRFKTADPAKTRYGMLEDGRIHELSGDVFGPYERTGRTFNLDDVTLLSPVKPSKVVAVGLNYRDHALEFGLEIPQEPMIFMKPATAVIGPMEPIIMPPMSQRVDYEAELAVVIGSRAKGVTKEEAGDYILGFTCLNDVTARDLQGRDGQWTRAKGFDTFCPLGPAIVTDLDPSDVEVSSWLNGEMKQSSRTSNLVFNVPVLVEFITSIMTLEPGDVIATGTPSGVGPVQDGDSIEIRIQGIGSLVNPVKAS
jgi:2-keto-4-pentenoate hydratase/2-oxohepta-3-ene-1,7-dioic acid hydratase in catechol pathway